MPCFQCLSNTNACTCITPLDHQALLHYLTCRRKLLGLILVKELVLVDPEEGLTAGQLVSRSLPRLPANIPMYQLLKLFEAGGSHMVALTCPQVPR
jgi:metal transporter CNNM